MKLKLLKPLPGAEVGTVLEEGQIKGCITVKIGDTVNTYDTSTLISTGWAGEIKEEERWKPNIGDDCHYFYQGDIAIMNLDCDWRVKSFEPLVEYGLCTRTREELEATLLLLKLRQSNGGWKPKEDEKYFTITRAGNTCELFFSNLSSDYAQDVLLGNCYRTREEAEKYAPEWKKLFESVTN